MKKTFRTFAQEMIQERDVDPDYIFINKVSSTLKFTAKEKAKWVLLKTIIYNSVSELEHIMNGVTFSILKFGNERQKQKHNAQSYLDNFYKTYPEPLEFFNSLAGNGNKAMQKITALKGFGPWAAWKLMDLCSCCLGIDIDFSRIDFREAYEYPLKGLLMVNGLPEETRLLSNDSVYYGAFDNAFAVLGASINLKEPCNQQRGINIQEIETLLCKYHSYIHNHYKIGEDVERLRKNIINSKFKNIEILLACAP